MRGCHAPLQRSARTFRCASGHSFDIARSGYVNLLQPQDRRSLTPGDSREAVEARARLLDAGIGLANVQAVVDLAASLLTPAEPPPVVVDLGCGGGSVLGRLAGQRLLAAAIGIDVSTPAIEFAARQLPSLTWVVANADRTLPLLDASVSLMLSVHARRNPDECRRVLAPAGRLLVVVPAADDLVELREAVQGEPGARERTAGLVDEHRPAFDLLSHTTVRERTYCDRAALLDLLRGTYRGERVSSARRVEALEPMMVTLASDVLLFAPRA